MSRDAVEPGNSKTIKQGWFEVREVEAGVYSILEPFHEEQVRSYLVTGNDRAVLIDTGMGMGDIRAVVADLTSLPVTVVNSHAHWDHIGGNYLFADIAIHLAEAHELPLGLGTDKLRRWFAPERLLGPLPEGFDIQSCSIRSSVASELLSGGERFDLGNRTLEAIHAPGHSPGGIVLLDRERGALFSTDVAYAGSLYAFGVDANLADYRRTLAMLAELAPTLKTLYPSHNAAPISPGFLPKMRDGLEFVVVGRAPERVDGPVARHEFDGFSILVDAGLSTPEVR
jgi:glyoxylase-like metal-dependent hydrolase (beta-lactamase superfamily II)